MTQQELPAHHKMGPSSSEKWLNCPGSVLAEADHEDTSSVFADEGSAAHELADWTLSSKEGLLCEDFIGEVAYTSEDGTEWGVTQEMADYVQEYVDYVHKIVKETGGELYVENRVFIDRIIPGAYGTADVIIIAGDTIYVIDLKYGKGVRVNAVETITEDTEPQVVLKKPNSQAMCYATGAYDEHDFGHIDKINIAIVQPRLEHISEHSITSDELNEWVDMAHGKFLATTVPNPPRNASKKGCMWCKAKGDCKAYIDMNLKEVVDDFSEYGDSIEALEDGGLKDPNKMSLEDLARLNGFASSITSLMKSVKQKLTDAALDGEDVPFHKLVNGNKSRFFIDPEKAEKAFQRKLGSLDLISPRSMLTAPQLEKLKYADGTKVKDSALFKKHVDSKPGNPVLVSHTDKREEYVVESVDDDFDDFDDEVEDSEDW